MTYMIVSKRLLATTAVALFGLTTAQTSSGGFFGPSAGWGSGTFSSEDVVLDCDWTTGESTLDGQIYTMYQAGTCLSKGVLYNGQTLEGCTLHVEYDLGTAPACTKSGNHWELDVHAQCKDFGSTATMQGLLECTNPPLQEPVGLGSKGGDGSFKTKDCSVFGGQSAVLLSHQILFKDDQCASFVSDTTKSAGQGCHADSGIDENAPIICKEDGTDTGTNTIYTDKTNDPKAVCYINDPWNADCTSGKGSNDSGVVKATWQGDPQTSEDGYFKIDTSSIDTATVKLNGRPAEKCQQKGDNKECAFLSCLDGEFIAPNGIYSMEAEFGTHGNTVACEGTVKIIQ
jgi:hypothetical protein